MDLLLQEIKNCTACADSLPLGPNPVVVGQPGSKILIVGQAPGTKVHQSGIPWNDASGRTLRQWMDISEKDFYNPNLVAIVPMGFCYPGKGKSGDLPPRKECAPLWHKALLDQMPDIQLTLLIGLYAQKYYLGKTRQKNLTETVAQFEEYLPSYLPLPHPSPRNRYWLTRNPWFEQSIIPILQQKVKQLI